LREPPQLRFVDREIFRERQHQRGDDAFVVPVVAHRRSSGWSCSLKLFWFECPIAHGPENYAALASSSTRPLRTVVADGSPPLQGEGQGGGGFNGRATTVQRRSGGHRFGAAGPSPAPLDYHEPVAPSRGKPWH